MRTPIFIILLLAAEVCGYGYQPVDHRVEMRIRGVSSGLNAFEIDFGRYPSTSEGLAVLLSRPESNSEIPRRGRYMVESTKDAWGREFVYRYPGLHNTNSYDLYSSGADGVSKSNGSDPDDINNWDTSRPWRTYYGRLEQMQAIRQLVFTAGPPVILLVLVWCVWRMFGRTGTSDEADS